MSLGARCSAWLGTFKKTIEEWADTHIKRTEDYVAKEKHDLHDYMERLHNDASIEMKEIKKEEK